MCRTRPPRYLSVLLYQTRQQESPVHHLEQRFTSMSSITAPAARRVVVGAATMHRAAACWSLRGSMIASSSRLQGPTPSPICAFSLWPAQKIAASSPSPSPPKPSSPPDPSSAGPSRASGKDLQRHPSIDRFEPGWAMSHSRYSEEGTWRLIRGSTSNEVLTLTESAFIILALPSQISTTSRSRIGS